MLSQRCKSLGGMAIKLNPIGAAGIPDRMVLLPSGRLVFVELKRPGERPRALQELWHKRLRSLGFEVLVLDSKESVDGAFPATPRERKKGG